MRPDFTDPIDGERFTREVVEAVNAAVQDAILRSKKLGLRIVDWHDDRVIWIEPQDIQVAGDRE